MLLRQEVLRAPSRARAKTGKRMAARIAIMAMTTRSSMSVKPCRDEWDERCTMLPSFGVIGGTLWEVPARTRIEHGYGWKQTATLRLRVVLPSWLKARQSGV